MKLIVTGGGTGGHIYPALAIADAFKKQRRDCEIVYIGTPNGPESTIVPAYGYKFRTVEVSGFKRKLSVENFQRGMKAFHAMFKARKMILEEKPDLVIGTGGYVSAPVVMSASMMGIPTAIHEQNVFPGVTNKFLSRFVDCVFLGFEKSKPRFERAKQIIYCGNPIRIERFNITKHQARNRLGIAEESKMLFSVGGSGGSSTLNLAIAGILPQLVFKEVALVHVTGKIHYSSFMEKIENIRRTPQQQIYSYIDNIAEYMAASDLVIGSAGAISLAEINYLGKASIIVPKAYTAENHQEYNAKMIEEAGAGFCILEKELTPDMLREKIYGILEEDRLRFSMEEKSRALSKNKSEDIILNVMSKHIDKRLLSRRAVHGNEN